MLRVGLTGGLGSGKSTAAKMFAQHGAYVLSADEIARELMQPGQAVYAAIVDHFGPSIVAADGSLDRPALASIAFEGGRIEELNAIVHPATIARQAEIIREVGMKHADAIVVVESALIFEARHKIEALLPRFDKIIVVVAPEELKIARFITRMKSSSELSDEKRDALAADARRRLSKQLNDDEKISRSDYVLKNTGSLEDLQAQVDKLWPLLREKAS